jgi:hypothetical protein
MIVIYLETYVHRQSIDVNSNIQCRLADVGVEIHNCITEFFNINCEQLVGVSNSVVQVRHLVISEAAII